MLEIPSSNLGDTAGLEDDDIQSHLSWRQMVYLRISDPSRTLQEINLTDSVFGTVGAAERPPRGLVTSVRWCDLGTGATPG